MNDFYFKKASQLKEYIGKTVYWDDVSSKYVFLRQGIVEEVLGHNVLISGEWYWFYKMKNWKIRNFKNGGSWKENEE